MSDDDVKGKVAQGHKNVAMLVGLVASALRGEERARALAKLLTTLVNGFGRGLCMINDMGSVVCTGEELKANDKQEWICVIATNDAAVHMRDAVSKLTDDMSEAAKNSGHGFTHINEAGKGEQPES